MNLGKITAVAALFTAVAAHGNTELSGSAALRGETVYGPGAKVPTTTIHIGNEPASKPPKPKAPNNSNLPKGNYAHACHPYAQVARFSGVGTGKWTNHLGRKYTGPWACSLETNFVLNNRLSFTAQCTDVHSIQARYGTQATIRWTGELVVVSDKKLKHHTCKVKSKRGYTHFQNSTSASAALQSGLNPVKSKKKTMFIGKKEAFLKIPADGRLFKLELDNEAHNDWH